MPVIRQLVNEVLFRLNDGSLKRAEAAVKGLARQMSGLSGTVKVKADPTAFRQVRQAIGGIKRDLAGLKNRTITITERTVRTGERNLIGEDRSGGEHRGRHGLPVPHTNPLGALIGAGIGLFSADEFVKMTNDWAQVSATIRSATKDQDDFAKSRQRVVDIARESRVGIEGVGNLFANFRSIQPVTGQTDNQLMSTVQTITRALAVAHQSPLSNLRTIRQLDNAVLRGKLTEGELHQVQRDNQQFYRFLEQSAGGPEKLLAFLKSSKNTSQGLVGLINGLAPVVDKQFRALPLTFSNAMQRVRDDLEETFGKLFVDTDGISDLLKPIVGIFDGITNGVDRLATKLAGGRKQIEGYRDLLHFIEIGLLGFLTTAIARTGVWAAGVAIANAPWIALGALITGIYLVLQDIYGWAHGWNSVTGAVFGSFDKWKPSIDRAKKALVDMWNDWQPALYNAKIELQNTWTALKPIFGKMGVSLLDAFRDPELRKNLGEIATNVDSVAKALLKFGMPAVEWAWKKEAEAALWVLNAIIWAVERIAKFDAGIGRFFGGAGATEDRAQLAAELKAHRPGTFQGVQDALAGMSSSDRGALIKAIGAPPIGALPPSTVLPASNRALSQSAVTNVHFEQTISAPSGSAPALAGMAEQGAQSGMRVSLDQARPSYPGFSFPGTEFGVTQ